MNEALAEEYDRLLRESRELALELERWHQEPSDDESQAVLRARVHKHVGDVFAYQARLRAAQSQPSQAGKR
jgi:hypothetical protein